MIVRKHLPIVIMTLFLLQLTIAQNEGTVTLKNGDVKEGLIKNKGSQILFFDKADSDPIKIKHSEIEHIQTGDIEFFRNSSKSDKLEEYQVIVKGETLFVARHFNTNYGKMKRNYLSSNGVSPYYNANATPVSVRGPRSKGMIIRYYIKKPEMNYVQKVYRLVVGDVDWKGYKSKVKKLLNDCPDLMEMMDKGEFKDKEYGKGAEIAAIVNHYNEKCD